MTDGVSRSAESTVASEAFLPATLDSEEEENQDSSFSQVFGDYDLLEEIGSGGMGVVYRARQRSLNRIVAVKRILPGIRPSDRMIRRFRVEAEAAARLRHRGIVAIHDIGEHEGQPFYSMEFIDGQPMSELVREGPLNGRRAVEYVFKIAQAVDYAHEQGIIHRDLKPSNILIDPKGEPLVTDFGLAKRLEVESDLTLSGQILGTPSFIPPEQVSSDEGKVGPRSDIYSIGAILYFAVTGRPPFQAASTDATLHEVLFSEPITPKSLNPNLPPDLETICLKCLEKEPNRRYSTARDLAEDLGHFLNDEPIRARPISSSERLWRWCRRKPLVAGLFAAVMLLLITIAIGSTFSVYYVSKSLEAERRENYINEIARAYNFIQDDQYNRARDVLNREDSAPYRGWEWGHLQWLCNQDDMTISGAFRNPQQIAFSPDSQFLAITALDGKLNVWDSTTGSLQFNVNAHAGAVTGLAYSRDGQRLLTCSPSDPKVRIWNAMNGAHESSFSTDLVTPFRLASSPDGKSIAVGGYKAIELRDALTFQLQSTLEGHADQVLAVEFSPDGMTLATGAGDAFPHQTSKDGSILLWDVESGRRLSQLTGHSDTVFSIAFNGDGTRLASVGAEGLLKLWDLDTGAMIRELGEGITGDRGPAFDVEFCMEDRYLLSAHLDSKTYVWDAESGAHVASLRGHSSLVYGLAVSQSRGRIASASFDQTLKLWSLETVLRPPSLVGGDKPVWALSFSSDSRHLATGSWDGTVEIWNFRNKALVQSIPVGFPIISLDLNSNAERLVTVGPKNVALVWDVESGEKVLELQGHENTVLCVAYSPDGTRIATGSKDHTIRLWDSEIGQLQSVLTSHEGWVHDVDFSPEGKRLASASADGAIKVWDAQTGRVHETLSGHRDEVLSVQFSHDGHWIASGSMDEVAKIWNAESGELLRDFTGHELQGSVKSIAWTVDDNQLATVSSETTLYRLGKSDSSVRIWDVESGHELLTLDSPTSGAYALAFSEDGRHLASAGRNPRFKLYQAIPWEGVKELSGRSRSEDWLQRWKRDHGEQNNMAIPEGRGIGDSSKKKNESLEPSERAFDIPPRISNTKSELLDLTRHFNASLNREWIPYRGLEELDLDLSGLPTGVWESDSVEFDIRGVVQLKCIESGWTDYPKQIIGIPVGRKLSRLHVLHGTVYDEAPGEIIGDYRLNYADGTSIELPIIYGTNVWDWSDRWGSPLPQKLRVAWSQPNHATSTLNDSLYLFQFNWDNPEQGKVVQSIDFVSRMTRSAPFLIAMTVE